MEYLAVHRRQLKLRDSQKCWRQTKLARGLAALEAFVQEYTEDTRAPRSGTKNFG